MLRDCQGALESRQRFAGLMKDCFPQERATVNLLSILHDIGIHTEMAKAERVTGDFAYRFTKRLVDDYGTNMWRAKSVVALFCTCYTEFLGKPCDLAGAEGQGVGEAANGQMPAPAQEQAAAPVGRTKAPRKPPSHGKSRVGHIRRPPAYVSPAPANVEPAYANDWTAKQSQNSGALQMAPAKQYELGLKHFNGDGIARNFQEAVKWLRMVAEQGNAGAQNKLGDMYYHGECVAEEYSEAVKWSRLAADHGNADAQYTDWAFY